jgi:YidC/Oxa1 family membrane protein insertase
VAWVFKQIYAVVSPIFGDSSGWTWALTIILLVVLMRLIMVPLFIKQMHTTRRMTALAPQMSALRKKYKNDKQTLNTEMMQLYQEAGVNPLMGCLPVVAQLPMFFALFSVLGRSRSGSRGPAQVRPDHCHDGERPARQDPRRHDRGQVPSSSTPLHAKVVILIAVLLSMITTYLTVRQSMKRGMMPTTPDSPMGNSQKYMAYIMPFFALSPVLAVRPCPVLGDHQRVDAGPAVRAVHQVPAPVLAAPRAAAAVDHDGQPSARPGPGRGRKTDPPPAGQPGDAGTGGQAPASGKPAAGGKPAPASGKPASTGRPAAGQQARKPAASSPSSQAQGNGGQAARKPAASGKPAAASGKPAAGGKPASSRPMGPSRPVTGRPACGERVGQRQRGPWRYAPAPGRGRSEPALSSRPSPS